MPNTFQHFHTDLICVASKEGLMKSTKKKASVTPESIRTYEIDIDVNEGDIIYRFLSNDKIESYRIISIFGIANLI